MPIEPMEFIKYDKICDDVYTIAPNVILRFNVVLSKITSDGKRYHFYKEFEYGSRANTPLITIKRTYDYYLSIENVVKNKITDEKAFIRIGPYDYHRFKSQLDTVYSWLTDNKKWKGLYAKNKGQIILTSPVPENTLGGYPQNKFIRFIPTVIDHDSGKGTEPGIEMDLSNYYNTAIMNIDRFMGLYYTVNSFNMYQAAQNLIGYIGFPSGHNRVNMSTFNSEKLIPGEEFEGEINGINDRVIGNKKNISSLE